MRARGWLIALAVVAAGCEAGPLQPTPQEEPSLNRFTLPTGTSCAELGLGTEARRVLAPASGTYLLDGINTVAVRTDRIYADWSSNIGMDAVIVHGGPGAVVYLYADEASAASDLTAPIDPSTGRPYAIDRVDFCYDYELDVSTNVLPALDRTFAWTVEKWSPVSELTMSPGESLEVPFLVTAAVASVVDDGWRVTGEVTVHIPAPFPAQIAGISHTYGGEPAPVDCRVAFPYWLASDTTLVCSFEIPLAAPVSGASEVEVGTSGEVGPGAATTSVDFALAVARNIDACVGVEDDRVGTLGVACAAKAPASWRYGAVVGPYEECGSFTYSNTATLTSRDTGATLSDSWSVGVSAPCAGCTLTPGYWKTHSSYGPAPYDATWALLPQGADTPFFLSGVSWLSALEAPPLGDAYWILAHAYIGAKLNALNGASLADVKSTFDLSTAALATLTPGTHLSGAERATLIGYATALDAFNAGLTGPGHCDE